MGELPWIRVWLQGGPADGTRWATLIEPPQRLYVVRDPFDSDRWIRAPVSLGGIAYVRVPSIEQFERERIYYPDERGSDL